MAIEQKEFKFEENKYNLTKKWLDDEIKLIENNDKELQDKIASLKKQAKGKYSEELETAQRLYEITHKNLENYNEAKMQPYFARIDFREYRKEKESYYIGKFGLGDSSTGDEIVIDWRAPIADLYYSGTQGQSYYKAPVGIINGDLSLKRKFLIKNNTLVDAFDEGINEIILNSGEEKGKALIDEFLRINLEESVSGKLKEVIATIQKEQNDIIRADKNGALIVQGSAGSGKTTVALHRLAYLLYKYKDKLSGEDIMVIAPNKLFLDYISEILPNLGVEKVKQKTFEEISMEILELKGKVYTKDKKLALVLEEKNKENVKYITNSSRLKGTMTFKVMMDRYIRLLEKKDMDVGDITVEGYTLFESKEIKRLYIKDMQHLPLNKRKDEIKRYFNLKFSSKVNDIMDKIDFSYEYMIARTKKSMEDGPERRKKLIEIYDERDNKKDEIKRKAKEAFDDYFNSWKEINTSKLYLELFTCRDILDEVSAGKIPEKLIDYIVSELNANAEKGVIDSDDLAAMLYLKFKIEGIPEKLMFKHIVIDEAQDYSLFQLYILRSMVSNNSLTIVGDIGQGIYFYKGIEDWNKVINDVFEKDALYTPLTQSYRSTVEIIEFANKVLVKQNNSLKPAMPVLRHGRAPQVIEFKRKEDFAKRVDEIIKEVEDLGKKSVAIIGRTYEECKIIRDIMKKYSTNSWNLIKDTDKNLKLENIIIPSYMTKGLEFDCTIIYNCNDENYGRDELDKKLLYVVLTRALHLEYIFYNGEISKLIL
ncbi:AAA family ATPase [Clostridium sp. SYSU_GA19001]|uniref:RNA polymerase recycling motor HelD n=1 Tax=Clostridium caldaquaticum TaxID=2940653 RepID=UPI00207763AD|nr:RNA polymerase recycling motor HelD [Clostridium caldaquaticum]MCM8711338.1 AAA family ATPase [Clostridium caldaquaticum]